MKATDGLGNPIVDGTMYYIQDTRGQVGNCALFWGRSGYVCNLDQARAYTADQARSMHRDTDVPWPISHVENHAIRHVRVEALHATEQAAWEKLQQEQMARRLTERGIP